MAITTEPPSFARRAKSRRHRWTTQKCQQATLLFHDLAKEGYAASAQPSASYDTPGGTDMQLPRRKFLHLGAGAAVLPVVSRIATAQAYPSRPVRLVVGFAAGGTQDVIARLLGSWLSERLGQQIVIENRAGAASNIAAEAVIKSPPDGYTLFMVGPNNAINASLYDRLSFDFVRDFAPVAGILRVPNVMEVHPS